MRAFLPRALVAATFALAACADAPASDGARTDETTASLLSAPQAAQPAEGAGQTLDIAVLGFDRGRSDAPVRVVEMSDYGCGYCRQFHEETWPVVLEEFVETGKVEWKFLPFVNGMFKNSPQATAAAECALEQGDPAFEAMNARIWGAQAEWKGTSEPNAVLRRLASDAGVDLERFDSCIAEDRRGDRVAAANALARQVGVRGTPTFFVVGYPPIQGALPVETFRQILTMVHADATKGAGR